VAAAVDGVAAAVDGVVAAVVVGVDVVKEHRGYLCPAAAAAAAAAGWHVEANL
jgi:hypothetical protein